MQICLRTTDPNLFFQLVLSTESRSVELNLSLVMEFLINVSTNFIFGKRLSREVLVTGRVTAISNNLYCINNHMQLCKEL